MSTSASELASTSSGPVLQPSSPPDVSISLPPTPHESAPLPLPPPETFQLSLPETDAGRFRNAAFVLNASMRLWMETHDWTSGAAPCGMAINFSKGNKTPLLRRLNDHQQKLRKPYAKKKSHFDENRLQQHSFVVILKGELTNEMVC